MTTPSGDCEILNCTKMTKATNSCAITHSIETTPDSPRKPKSAKKREAPRSHKKMLKFRYDRDKSNLMRNRKRFSTVYIDGVQVPYIYREWNAYILVSVINEFLLARYPRCNPGEFRDFPPLDTQEITAEEASILNRVEKTLFGEFGGPFMPGDLIVKLDLAVKFYFTVKEFFSMYGISNSKTMPDDNDTSRAGLSDKELDSNGGPSTSSDQSSSSSQTEPQSSFTTRPDAAVMKAGLENLSLDDGRSMSTYSCQEMFVIPCGWLLIRKTVVPCLKRVTRGDLPYVSSKLVPLPIVQQATKLMSLPEVISSDLERYVLNLMCWTVGHDFHFPDDLKLVRLSEVMDNMGIDHVHRISDSDPFESARRIVSARLLRKRNARSEMNENSGAAGPPESSCVASQTDTACAAKGSSIAIDGDSHQLESKQSKASHINHSNGLVQLSSKDNEDSKTCKPIQRQHSDNGNNNQDVHQRSNVEVQSNEDISNSVVPTAEKNSDTKNDTNQNTSLIATQKVSSNQSEHNVHNINKKQHSGAVDLTLTDSKVVGHEESINLKHSVSSLISHNSSESSKTVKKHCANSSLSLSQKLSIKEQFAWPRGMNLPHVENTRPAIPCPDNAVNTLRHNICDILKPEDSRGAETVNKDGSQSEAIFKIPTLAMIPSRTPLSPSTGQLLDKQEHFAKMRKLQKIQQKRFKRLGIPPPPFMMDYQFPQKNAEATNVIQNQLGFNSQTLRFPHMPDANQISSIPEGNLNRFRFPHGHLVASSQMPTASESADHLKKQRLSHRDQEGTTDGTRVGEKHSLNTEPTDSHHARFKLKKHLHARAKKLTELHHQKSSGTSSKTRTARSQIPGSFIHRVVDKNGKVYRMRRRLPTMDQLVEDINRPTMFHKRKNPFTGENSLPKLPASLSKNKKNSGHKIATKVVGSFQSESNKALPLSVDILSSNSVSMQTQASEYPKDLANCEKGNTSLTNSEKLKYRKVELVTNINDDCMPEVKVSQTSVKLSDDSKSVVLSNVTDKEDIAKSTQAKTFSPTIQQFDRRKRYLAEAENESSKAKQMSLHEDENTSETSKDPTTEETLAQPTISNTICTQKQPKNPSVWSKSRQISELNGECTYRAMQFKTQLNPGGCSVPNSGSETTVLMAVSKQANENKLTSASSTHEKRRVTCEPRRGIMHKRPKRQSSSRLRKTVATSAKSADSQKERLQRLKQYRLPMLVNSIK